MNKKLLDFQINSFKRGSQKINMIPIELNKNIINKLLEGYKYFEITKENYTINLAPEEYTEDYYDKEIAKICLHYIMDMQYKCRDELENRVYISEEDICVIYFYGRDIGDKVDYIVVLNK